MTWGKPSLLKACLHKYSICIHLPVHILPPPNIHTCTHNTDTHSVLWLLWLWQQPSFNFLLVLNESFSPWFGNDSYYTALPAGGYHTDTHTHTHRLTRYLIDTCAIVQFNHGVISEGTNTVNHANALVHANTQNTLQRHTHTHTHRHSYTQSSIAAGRSSTPSSSY